MNGKRFFSIFSIIIFLSIVMFKFQNCAAPNTGDEQVLTEEGSGPGFVDDLVNKKLAFVENLIVTKHDKDIINFDGLCDKESHGKVVQWVIEDVSTRDVVQEGSSECIRGGFRITSEQMNDLECNIDFDLVAAVDEHHDNVIVRKKCKPMSIVEDESDSSSFGYGKKCYFELESDLSQNQESCRRVCYSSGKLYSRKLVDNKVCSK